MSAATATASTVMNKKFSLGPVMIEIQEVSTISGDTTCVATAKSLHTVDYAILISSLVQTAVPTYSATAKTATFTFTDPTAVVKGQIILFGK